MSNEFLEYIESNINEIISLLIEHIELTFLSVLLAYCNRSTYWYFDKLC